MCTVYVCRRCDPKNSQIGLYHTCWDCLLTAVAINGFYIDFNYCFYINKY